MEKLLYNNYIYPKIKLENFEDIVNYMSKPLIENGDVKEEFPYNVKIRQNSLPTGLPTKKNGIAIPHTDSKYVNNNRIAVATLNNPIKMRVMGGTVYDQVEVYIIFLLALGESNKQLNILAKLMELFQDENTINAIYNSSSEDICTKLSKIMEGDIND